MTGFHQSAHSEHTNPHQQHAPDHRHSDHHHHDHDHHHHDHGPTNHRLQPLRSRRAFLGDFGRGTLAMAVFTPLLAACGSNTDADSNANADQTGDAGTDGSSATETSSSSDETEADETAQNQTDDAGDLQWTRVNLGFVSAYVLARGNSAAIVDTGTAGSAGAIGSALETLGLGYQDVDHVILTHRHPDHIGSINEILANTPSASVYAGQADLGQILIDDGTGFDPDKIIALNGGEDVFGFETVATPGHTAGHMAVIDHAAGILVAGDAVFTEDGAAVEGPQRFFEDVEQSRQSIATLAALSFNTLLIGHGDPLESGADAAVAALAASFG